MGRERPQGFGDLNVKLHEKNRKKGAAGLNLRRTDRRKALSERRGGKEVNTTSKQ